MPPENDDLNPTAPPAGPLQLSDDQLEQIVDSLAERLAGAAPPAHPAPTNQGQPSVFEQYPQLGEARDLMMRDMAAMVSPFILNAASEGIQQVVPAYHLGADGLSQFREHLSKMNAHDIKAFTESNAHVLLAKAIAYDQLVAGNTGLEKPIAGSVRMPSGEYIGSSPNAPSRIEELPLDVREEIAQANRLRGKDYTIDELREEGYLN